MTRRLVVAMTWSSQVALYPARRAPGITEYTHFASTGETIRSLLYYDPQSRLRGIFNYFPYGMAGVDSPGAFNIVVDPKYRRRGYATSLLDAGYQRWGLVLDAQRWTTEGQAFREAYERKSP